MKSIVTGMLAVMLALTLSVSALAASAEGDGRVQRLLDPEKMEFYDIPFIEQTDEGWEPPVQQSDGTWNQRFVYDGVAYTPGHYAGLAEPPYPYPYVVGRTTVTWIPQWGSWYVVHPPGQRYLDSIVGATGGTMCVRKMDGTVADWTKPVGKEEPDAESK